MIYFKKEFVNKIISGNRDKISNFLFFFPSGQPKNENKNIWIFGQTWNGFYGTKL